MERGWLRPCGSCGYLAGHRTAYSIRSCPNILTSSEHNNNAQFQLKHAAAHH